MKQLENLVVSAKAPATDASVSCHFLAFLTNRRSLAPCQGALRGRWAENMHLRVTVELEDRMVGALHLQHPDSEHNCGRGTRAIFKGTEKGESHGMVGVRKVWTGAEMARAVQYRVSNSEEFNSQLKLHLERGLCRRQLCFACWDRALQCRYSWPGTSLADQDVELVAFSCLFPWWSVYRI